MVAVNVRNWAHIMSAPPATSWSGLIINDVKASPTAAKKLLTATNFSVFESCIIALTNFDKHYLGY